MATRKTRSSPAPARPASRSTRNGSSTRASARSTVSGPAAAPAPAGDAAAAKLAGTQALAAAMPYNPNKALRVRRRRDGAARGRARAPPDDPAVTGSTLTETQGVARRSAAASRRRGVNPTNGPLDRVRVDSSGAGADDQPGRADRRQPELAEGGPARADAARGLHPPREDHALRPRAHSRSASCTRAAPARTATSSATSRSPSYTRASLFAEAGKRTPVFVRFSTVAGERGSTDTRARRARLRGQVLHRRGQLGPRRQQHPGVLHPGRDEVPRPDPRGRSPSRTTRCRRRRPRTTRSGTSCR